ncbi:hypothetical protein ACLB2K_002405 [Fragaria x ananassa]
MRTAAARRGLGLAATSARQKIGLSLFMRRSSTTSAAAAAAAAEVWKKQGMKSGSGSESESEMELELELNKEKSLYLCFCERSQCGGVDYENQVVRPIRLNRDDDGEEEYLRVAAYKRSSVNMGWNLSSRFGSHLLFPFGPDIGDIRHIRWIDTSTRPMKFQDSSQSKTKFMSFSTPKTDPLLGAVNGKLYCIDNKPFRGIPQVRPFEVFDPENGLQWQPLDAPPFLLGWRPNLFDASFLEGSNKILGWARKKPGVFCFDATKPENGWSESSGNTLPCLGYHRPPVFIQNHHPDIGAFHVMFFYDPIDAPLLVTAFFMSDSCDDFHRIEHKPLQLPELCNEYKYTVPSFISDIEFFHLDDPISTDFEFVHLGDRKVCLVMNKFFSDDACGGRNTGILLLVTFEYDIITTVKDSKSTVQIQTRLLGTRRFRYHSRQLRKPDYTQTLTVDLTGAFLL